MESRNSPITIGASQCVTCSSCSISLSLETTHRFNNMKSICLYFQVHQPFRLRKFPFFEIGMDTEYFDDEGTCAGLKKVTHKCYLPTYQLLMELFAKHGPDFRLSFSISGTILDQFERYMPEVIESFQKLAETGNVKFLGETYGHSLSALRSEREFAR